MAAVEFRDVSFRYFNSDRFAISKINLTVEEGELLGIMGRSGSGKTTLCMCINGLIPRFFSGELHGSVKVFGVETKTAKVSELSTIVGTVFQNPDSQLVASTVEGEVAFGPENLALSRGEILKRVNASLKEVGIEKLRRKHPSNLSGGEKQLVAIASILAMEPKILVLDEPTSQLDLANKELVLNVIRRLHRKGMTVILVEHNVEALAEFTDRIILMDKGRIVCDGEPEKVLTNRRVLSDAGLHPPPVTQLAYRLIDDGFPLKKIPVRLDDACRIILNSFNEGCASRKPCFTVHQHALALHEYAHNGTMAPHNQRNTKPSLFNDESDAFIRLENVVFFYEKGKTVLDGVSLNFFPGELVAVMGCNGSGKTTLAKLICGLLKPVKGRVLVKGCDTRKMSVSKVSESVSLVFQNPILQIFTSSVEDELKLALVTRGFPEELIHERVEEVIRLLDLEECRFKDPYRLSRGEQQRVITGAVMTVKPEVIVLDEPTTGQDVPRRIKMIKYLKDLTLLGITVILVTHDVELTPYCSRLIVLGNGGVLADGEPREILYNMDLLENAGLKPPQLVRLAIRMQDDTNPVTLDEMAQSILSRLPKAMVET